MSSVGTGYSHAYAIASVTPNSRRGPISPLRQRCEAEFATIINIRWMKGFFSCERRLWTHRERFRFGSECLLRLSLALSGEAALKRINVRWIHTYNNC